MTEIAAVTVLFSLPKEIERSEKTLKASEPGVPPPENLICGRTGCSELYK